MSIQHKTLHANRHAKNKIEMFTTPNKNDSLTLTTSICYRNTDGILRKRTKQSAYKLMADGNNNINCLNIKQAAHFHHHYK